MGYYGYGSFPKITIHEANSHDIATGWIADSMPTSALIVYK